MANPNPIRENLIPNSQRTPEELRRQTRKGGKVSGRTRRRQKQIREIIDTCLKMRAPGDIKEALEKKFGYNLSKLNNKEAMTLSMLGKALVNSDHQAFNALLDRLDGKPMQKTETELGPETREAMADYNRLSDKELETAIKLAKKMRADES
jgi:hypothetical protein